MACGSKFFTATHKRYAQIEEELLAILYGWGKFKQYLYGKQVQVESDKLHESMFTKGLYKAPPRVQRMRLQALDLRVAYKPSTLHIVDTLSRAYLQEQTQQLLEEEL